MPTYVSSLRSNARVTHYGNRYGTACGQVLAGPFDVDNEQPAGRPLCATCAAGNSRARAAAALTTETVTIHESMRKIDRQVIERERDAVVALTSGARPSLLPGPFRTGAANLAIVMAMTSAAEHLPLADVKNRLSEVVERLEREHGRVVITKHGRPAAVVLSIEDLEGLEETLEILSDKPLMRRLRKSQAEVEAGAATELGKDEALALVRGRR